MRPRFGHFTNRDVTRKYGIENSRYCDAIYLPFPFQYSLLFPLKTPENQRFSDIFSGIKRNIGKNRVERLCQRVIKLNQSETQLNITSTILMNMRFGEMKDVTLTHSKFNLGLLMQQTRALFGDK